MKTLFLDQYAEVGGGQVVLLEMLKLAQEKSTEVGLWAPGGGELQDRALKDNPELQFKNLVVPSMTMGSKGLGDAFRLLKHSVEFRKFSKDLATWDLIYVNGPRLYLPAALATLSRKNSVIYHVHLEHSSIEKKLVQLISKMPSTRQIVFSSQFLMSRAGEVSRARVVSNSLSATWSELKLSPRVRQVGEPLRVMLLGRLTPEKGHEWLIEGAKRLPLVEFYVVGGSDFADPDYEGKLKARAPKNVKIVGKIEASRLPGWIEEKRIHVAWVPSQVEESFGLTLIEGQAASCLGLTTARGGLAEIAQKTRSWTAKTLEESVNQLKKIETLTPELYQEIVSTQWGLTREFYAADNFKSAWLSLLEDQTK